MFWATLPSPHTICQEEGGGGGEREGGGGGRRKKKKMLIILFWLNKENLKLMIFPVNTDGNLNIITWQQISDYYRLLEFKGYVYKT